MNISKEMQDRIYSEELEPALVKIQKETALRIQKIGGLNAAQTGDVYDCLREAIGRVMKVAQQVVHDLVTIHLLPETDEIERGEK